jgi:hypothetical protein
MFRFTIRDVLWLTVVVGVALSLWLGWSRETARLREESAAREAKLRDEVAAERDKANEKMSRAIRELMMKSKVQEAQWKAQFERLKGLAAEN